MRIRIQTLTFGIVAGCLWSLVPGTLGELYRSEGQVLTVLLAGVVTGVLTSIALSGLLEKSRRVLTLLLGLLALPLGAFLFGISISVVQLAVNLMTGVVYRFAEEGFHPVRVGIEYALISSFTIFALILFPLAVLTTFLLQSTLTSGGQSSKPL